MFVPAGKYAELGNTFEKNHDATLYCGNLDNRVDEELLCELFIQCGPVKSVHIPRDKVTGVHSGYGFVEFELDTDAEYAQRILNMIKVYGKPIKCSKATQDKKTSEIGANIFVGNLADEVDEKLLHNTFMSFGTVLSIKIIHDEESEVNRSYAFISYDTFEASDAAISTMNGQYFCNRQINVSYAYKKDTKGERHGSEAERLIASKIPKTVELNATSLAFIQPNHPVPGFNPIPIGNPHFSFAPIPTAGALPVAQLPSQLYNGNTPPFF